jgi:hypothetical protein
MPTCSARASSVGPTTSRMSRLWSRAWLMLKRRDNSFSFRLVVSIFCSSRLLFLKSYKIVGHVPKNVKRGVLESAHPACDSRVPMLF